MTTQSYFDRTLSLDLTGLQKMQPRIRNARKLLDQNELVIVKRISATEVDVRVPGIDTQHYVRARDDGDVCSCRWHSEYQGNRGPCKHILAARMLTKLNQSEPNNGPTECDHAYQRNEESYSRK